MTSRVRLPAFLVIGGVWLFLEVSAGVALGDGFPPKGPYFLVDSRVVEDRWHVQRFVVPLERHPRNPIMAGDRPWEEKGPFAAGSTLRDPDDGLFKMWYGIFNERNYYEKLPFSYNICYAESRDGLTWTKPNLGVFDHRGSRQNNCIRLGHEKTQSIDVELNPGRGASGPKFVSIHNDKGGVFVSTSNDGKSFEFSYGASAVRYHSDTHNNFVYDEVRDRWLMFVRPKAYAGSGLKGVGRRRVAVKESRDLENWTPERTVLIPEENDPEYFYSMVVFRRGDLFFGALQVYETVHHHLDLELAWSGDGYRWDRLPIRADARLLSHGPPGSWDAGMVSVMDRPVSVGEELWFYYGGLEKPHNEFSPGAIGIATTKRDRLAGVRGKKGANGRLLTRPFVVTGDLVINARARGAIRVSVHTVDDEAKPGWGVAECTPFSGDAIESEMTWGKRGLAELSGRTVRLRFHLDDAELYAFDSQAE